MIRFEMQFATIDFPDHGRHQAGRDKYDGEPLEHPMDVDLRAMGEATSEQIGGGEGKKRFGHEDGILRLVKD